MAKTAKKPARKPRQKALPGMGQRASPKIESLARKYLDRRDEWMGAKQPFINARDLLEAAMKEEKVTAYEFDNKIIAFDGPEPHVKVRVKKGAEDA